MKKTLFILTGTVLLTCNAYSQSFLEEFKDKVVSIINKSDAKALLRESSVPFWFNSSDINYFGKETLDAVIEAVNAPGAEKITEIYIKSFAINEPANLENERSVAVRNYLIENGVSSDRLKLAGETSGMGDIINDRLKNIVPDDRKSIFMIVY